MCKLPKLLLPKITVTQDEAYVNPLTFIGM